MFMLFCAHNILQFHEVNADLAPHVQSALKEILSQLDCLTDAEAEVRQPAERLGGIPTSSHEH